jgi:hypothetical protein
VHKLIDEDDRFEIWRNASAIDAAAQVIHAEPFTIVAAGLDGRESGGCWYVLGLSK